MRFEEVGEPPEPTELLLGAAPGAPTPPTNCARPPLADPAVVAAVDVLVATVPKRQVHETLKCGPNPAQRPLNALAQPRGRRHAGFCPPCCRWRRTASPTSSGFASWRVRRSSLPAAQPRSR